MFEFWVCKLLEWFKHEPFTAALASKCHVHVISAEAQDGQVRMEDGEEKQILWIKGG